MSKGDWKEWIEYPYKGNAIYNPQYIKDRDEFFAKSGNGWWWGNGVWNGKHISSMERQRRYRENDK